MMESPKFFIGPMTKNVVDACISFSNKTGIKLALIPSRRQIENSGGYVNNWTTEVFSKYVRYWTDNIILVRDHSGPMQGNHDDDGIESLVEDSKFMDVIHIDPWKKYKDLIQGTHETASLLKKCFNLNSKLEFEIGTEESIRKFSTNELESMILMLKSILTEDEFKAIRYLVIQSGTSLQGNDQTGNYDKDRLSKMIEISKKYGLTSKEHNGDYLPEDLIFEKFSLGLESINIAPEFGLIETETYLDNIKGTSDFETFWSICLESNRWKKWVNENFNPEAEKESLIKICGHYVISDSRFLDIRKKFPNINSEIQSKIFNKLKKLHGI